MTYSGRMRDAMTVSDVRPKDGPFKQTLAGWTSRELQLTRLHEELISRREALLNCSQAYQQSQENRSANGVLPLKQAVTRNQRLIEDIKKSKNYLYEEMDKSPSPRFMTLQKNYWAMVKSQVPMWEQDLGIQRPVTETRSRSMERKSGPQPKQSKKNRSRRSKTPR